MIRARPLSIGLLAAALLWPNLRTSRAGEWPQILGPHRNGQAEAERLAKTWPAAGPPRLWKYPLGSGYAGPAIVGGQAIVFHRVGDQERLEMLELDTGRPIWNNDGQATYRGGIDPDRGPRCVPLVHAQGVFVIGAAGDARRVAVDTGETIWTRGLAEDYGAPEGYFGAGSTPIVTADRLLVNLGGRDGAGIVALSLDDGRTIWKATTEAASYSSPASLPRNHPATLFVTRLHAVGLDSRDGNELFRYRFGQRGPTVNAATPILIDPNHVFLTASYGVGGVLLDVTGATPRKVWASDEVLSSQYATPVYYQGYLYGIHGREDVGVAELRCVEAKTGRVAWKQPGFGVAHLLLADEKLLILKVTGELILAEPSPLEFHTLASARVAEATTRALPALSNGRLCFRENSNDGGALICVQVGP